MATKTAERNRFAEELKEKGEIVIKPDHGDKVIYTTELLEVIRNTVAKNATWAELYYFLDVAQSYGLSPFKREIWFIKLAGKDGAKTRIETSRDGYATICRRDPGFLGYHSEVVRENDEFYMEYNMGKVVNIHHKFSHKDRGKIAGAWAVAKHGTKDDVWAWLPYDEMDQHTPVWKKNGSLMAKKVVEAAVLKRMGGISGILTENETRESTDRFVSDMTIEEQEYVAQNEAKVLGEKPPEEEPREDTVDAEYVKKPKAEPLTDEEIESLMVETDKSDI